MSHEISINFLQYVNEQGLAALLYTPFCCYCLNEEEPYEKCTSHYMREITGEISCPKLQMDGCSECGAKGEFVHHVSECPILEKDSTICSIPAAVISKENGLGMNIVNTSGIIERKKRKFKKEMPLRVVLLQRLHEQAEMEYQQKIEETFEAHKKMFIEEEIQSRKRSRRKPNEPRKCESANEDDDYDYDLIIEDIESNQDCNASRIKRHRLAI